MTSLVSTTMNLFRNQTSEGKRKIRFSDGSVVMRFHSLSSHGGNVNCCSLSRERWQYVTRALKDPVIAPLRVCTKEIIRDSIKLLYIDHYGNTDRSQKTIAK